jgi:hypothetical protein
MGGRLLQLSEVTQYMMTHPPNVIGWRNNITFFLVGCSLHIPSIPRTSVYSAHCKLCWPVIAGSCERGGVVGLYQRVRQVIQACGGGGGGGGFRQLRCAYLPVASWPRLS